MARDTTGEHQNNVLIKYMPTALISPQENSPLSVFSLLLNSALLRWLVTEMIQLWRTSRFRGNYTVHTHHITLELIDNQGTTAVYTKRQTVEFLQDGIFAIQDQAWGAGDIFADYRCSPGVAVDRYEEGFRWKILISLRRTRNKGETETFLIERTIKQGFTTPTAYLQTMIDHPTKDFTFSVIFPPTRVPTSVVLIEENRKHVYPLGDDHRTPLSQGRLQYSWHTPKARLYEGYILQWEW